MVYSLRVFVEQRSDGEKLQPRLFIPGDRVVGKVVLTLTEDETVENIIIDLKGKCKTKIVRGSGQNRHTHRYELEFYTDRRLLFKGPFKMRADTYEYPFAFQLPESFTYTASGFSDQNWSPEYSTMGTKPLPPTCLGPYGRHECEIYYRLTARVPKTFSDWEDKYHLNFSPPRTVSDPNPLLKANENNASTYHRHYRLTDDGTCRTLTTRESLKETFKHNAATNSVNFTLNAVAPIAIVIGRPYTIDLTLASPDEATGNIMPDFKLKAWALILKSRTDIRVPGLFSDHQQLLEDHIEINHGTLNIPILLNKSLRITGMFPKDRIYAPPTFDAWAVRRNYGLELKIDVECLGETSSFKVKWPHVFLYPAKMEGGVEEAIKAIESGTAQLGIEQQGGLPAYEGGSGSVVPQVEEELPSYGHAMKGQAA
jgi:hypothetical protein